MKLDERRLTAQIHECKKPFVVLRAEMTQQVVLRPPPRLVAKRVRVWAFLKKPATYTSRLYLGRSGPCG
jgi:hypothetical protein